MQRNAESGGPGERSGRQREDLAAERAQGPFQRPGHAREGRRVALGVAAGLGGAQLLHQVQETAGMVGLEGDDELLVVEAERIAGVEIHARELLAVLYVLMPDTPPLLGVQQVPLAGLHERIDEEVLPERGADLEAC